MFLKHICTYLEIQNWFHEVRQQPQVKSTCDGVAGRLERRLWTSLNAVCVWVRQRGHRCAKLFEWLLFNITTYWSTLKAWHCFRVTPMGKCKDQTTHLNWQHSALRLCHTVTLPVNSLWSSYQGKGYSWYFYIPDDFQRMKRIRSKYKAEDDKGIIQLYVCSVSSWQLSHIIIEFQTNNSHPQVKCQAEARRS